MAWTALSANSSQVADSDGLTSDTGHLNGIAEGRLMVDRGLLVVSQMVVDHPQVHVRYELPGRIPHLIVLRVILYRVLVVACVLFPQTLVGHSNAIKRQRLAYQSEPQD